MEWADIIRIWGPLGLIAALFVLLLRWVLDNMRSMIEVSHAGTEAARASTEVIRNVTEAMKDNTHKLDLVHNRLANLEKGQKRGWEKKSLP